LTISYFNGTYWINDNNEILIMEKMTACKTIV